MTAAPSPSSSGSHAMRWHLASMNDGLFIINAPARPSNDDIWPDNPNGPSVVLNVTELPEAKAIKIVGVLNDIATSPTPQIAGVREALKPFAEIALCQDFDPAAADMIDMPDFAITPNDVRHARFAFAALSPQAQVGDPAHNYTDLVRELHQASEQHDRGHGPLHACAANAIDHLMTLIRLMQPGGVAQAVQEPRKMYDSQTGDHYVIDADGNAYEPASPPAALPAIVDRDELIALLQDLASVNLSREAVERQARRMADDLIARGLSLPSTQYRCTCGAEPYCAADQHDISCPLAISSTTSGSAAK